MNRVSRILEEKILEIENDTLHGANGLSVQALELLKMAALEGENGSVLRDVACRLAKARPMMASVFNIANALLWFLEDHEDSEVSQWCDRMALSMKRANETAITKGAESLPESGRVLTHSNSSMVRDTLMSAKEMGKSLDIVCMEARPGQEGEVLARTLCEAGFHVELIVDAAMGLALEHVDVVMVGADGIGTFGLVHKVGTKPLALMAKETSRSLLCIATSYKCWPIGVSIPEEPPKKEEEIVERAGCIDGFNRYFDITPLEWIDRVVTGKGVLAGVQAVSSCALGRLHPLLRSPSI